MAERPSKRSRVAKHVRLVGDDRTSSEAFVARRNRGLRVNPHARQLSEAEAARLALDKRAERCRRFTNDRQLRTFWNAQLRDMWDRRERIIQLHHKATQEHNTPLLKELEARRRQLFVDLQYVEGLVATCADRLQVGSPAVAYPFDNYGELAPVE